ncbi:L-arabinose isomerase [Paraglaciecola hydrolytica]|uniref:L-arabinose isomerase n=1 Tax=Paraglaciecola hydrolytica TaxID=1799789 RepID=A0A148KLL0_9ALTE|nr:L-arabinose isomerase [Paraglaciecola hydrolytica]KXI27138.1 L-arabinose isomerase [Paraglaciecola hydrolytica]
MPTNSIKNVWFVTGSQDLYGPKVLASVAENSQAMVKELNETAALNVNLVWQPTVKSPEEIYAVCQAANTDPNCVGLVLWMHTFSPAKMWIKGLNALSKPWLHLHTQFNAALPWADIDMNYMNLHQSAHGDREFGHIGTRMRIERKVVAGYWRNKDVQKQMDDWCRAASGWHESRHLKVARFGDNMRQVAVTEGDKVSAQIQFGYEVNAYGIQDLVDVVNQVSASDIKNQIELYKNDYIISADALNDSYQYKMFENEARLELGMLKFLNDGKYKAFTNCFENLAGMTGLPGLATQRLMSQGFGYGGEGDWKTSAMVRIMKVMGEGRTGGTSFMEDYTYNFGAVDQVLGAHMLEICPTISQAKARLEVHRHTIGVKCDVARLLFTASPGPSINVSPIDMGNRFRIIVSEADTVIPPAELPKLPVGGAVWEPKPNLSVASAAWIHAGGAHHSAYSQTVTTDMIIDYAEMAGVETVVIDADTTIRSFKNELRQSAAYYHLNRGL